MSKEEIKNLIKRRRLQILVHSYIYYELNESLISDNMWDLFAKSLVELQKTYPELSKEVEYYMEFKDFDGSTGYSLPYRLPKIIAIANSLIKNNKKDNYFI